MQGHRARKLKKERATSSRCWQGAKLDRVNSHGKYCLMGPGLYGPILACSIILPAAVFAVVVHDWKLQTDGSAATHGYNCWQQVRWSQC